MDNSYGFEHHVAQQSRRDKLRVPQRSVKNAILPPEMTNFPIDSDALSDHGDILLRQEMAPAQCSSQILTSPLSSFSTSLLKSSGEIVNGGYWKGSHQSCDWAVNCGSNSFTHSSVLNGEVTDSSYIGFQTSSSFTNQDGQKRIGELNLPQLYLQDVVTSASVGTQDIELPSIVQHNFREINRGSGNELTLLPVYRDHSNVLPFDNSWIGELGRKHDEELRAFMSDSNPQGLSLSLSSNPPSKLQFEGSEELQKTVKSENLCGVPKPSVGGKNCGKSLQDMIGVPMNTYRNTGPLGPFTGYATILKSSKFLKPAQLLMDEFCGSKFDKTSEEFEEVGAGASSDATAINALRNDAVLKGNYSCAEASTFYGSNETSFSGVGSISSESHQPEYQQKKAKLLFLLEEVCRRYKQYHQQMQMVVSSFESVAGLSSASPYLSLALKTVSRQFRCLKNAISEQLKYLRKILGEDLSPPTGGTSSTRGDASSSRFKIMEQSFQKQKSDLANMGFLESPHVWRPQRGLPERAVAILRAWLFEHFLHPYPTDTDKHMLATQTGLSRNQVSNWFINARVRVWKPMVEEIHMLETKGLAEMNKTHHGPNDGSSRIENTSWVGVDQPLKSHVGNEVADQHLQCLGVDSAGGNRNGLSDQQWNNDKRSKLEGELVGFMPYQPSAVALTLGLRHHQQQRRQLQQQDDQVMRHYGSEMIHDFVG